VLVAVPVLVIAVALIVTRMVPQFRVMQRKIDSINRMLREQISGVRVVRAFVREPAESQRFGTANDGTDQHRPARGRLMALMFPTVMLVMNASSVAVLWFGGHRVDAGDIQVGTLMAFLNYLIQILMSVMMATFMLVMVPRARSAPSGSRRCWAPRPRSPRPCGLRRRPPPAAGWSCVTSSFRYPGADDPVLKHIDLSIEPGRTTAIIGSHRCRQDDPDLPDPAAVRRHRWQRAGRRGSTCGTWRRTTCGRACR
jgi:ATP-binding cassette subfamily B protein